MSQKLSMLCVFAHPDDECLGPGGTIARYVLEGVDVNLLTFTRGEAGSIGISAELEPDELARRREKELDDACRILGVGHRIVGEPDKGLSDLDEASAVAQIQREIEAHRPQVLMTFHHHGISGHPDHQAVARFLRAAFLSAGDDGPAHLFEYGITAEVGALFQRDSFVPMSPEEIDAVIEVSDEAMDRKIGAIEAHVTQIDFYRRLESMFDYRTAVRPEHFHLRETRLPRPQGQVDDLFAGVRDA